MEQKKFWMCYVDGEYGTTYKHETFKDAMKAAGKLSEVTNKPVYVLEAKRIVIARVIKDVQVVSNELND